ncbi:AAA family ATPase [Enhygromyxa salina]|uniref:ATPase family n=1 Tax=Enhygromyxa salina TaxID=215803 RepID=A0A2S9YMY2_9BACT|nr:AAA family ATPase [Enhygromyxa salina]PRQ06453.1 ATPase family [Enhygromyxa salina]
MTIQDQPPGSSSDRGDAPGPGRQPVDPTAAPPAASAAVSPAGAPDADDVATAVRSDFEQSKHITHTLAPPITNLEEAYGVVQRVRDRLRVAIRGRDDEIELIIIALLADGHVLLEDYPGSGKTTLAKALGDCIIDDQPHDDIVTIRRIQFTPDLLPSDVTGTTIFDPNTNRFFFRPGPIFAHVVLADEINRTSPKVQSALLEAMAEKQTTVDNRTRQLDELFFVLATQNPLDLAGTFPLPSAQLDRFLFKIIMKHIDRASELEVLASIKSRRHGAGRELPRVTRTEVIDARRVVEDQVYVAAEVREALVDIANATRQHEQVLQGVSTRALVLMIPALQARAVTAQRNYVSADDIEALSYLVFGHRLELAPGADSLDGVIKECSAQALERLARVTLHKN